MIQDLTDSAAILDTELSIVVIDEISSPSAKLLFPNSFVIYDDPSLKH